MLNCVWYVPNVSCVEDIVYFSGVPEANIPESGFSCFLP